LNELIKKLLLKYNISFKNFVKSNDNDIKEIIKYFFEKINSVLSENYLETEVNDLIRALLKSNTKSNFLIKEILKPVIIKLVDKIFSFGAKRLKYTILELLYIIVISFTSKIQLFQNITQQKKDIKRFNRSSSVLLNAINTNNRKIKMALIVLQRVNNKATQLNSLGPSVTTKQKQEALDEELKQAMKQLRVTNKSLALVVRNNPTTLSKTTVGKEFLKKLKNSLPLLEGPTHTPRKNPSNLVVPKSQNNNSSQNKKTKMALIVLQRLHEKESSLKGTNFTNEQIQKALDKELKKVTKELDVTKISLAQVVGNHNTPPPLKTKAGIDYYNKLKSSLLQYFTPTPPIQPNKNSNKPVVSTSQTRINANSSKLTYNSLTANIKSEIVNKLKMKGEIKKKKNIVKEIVEEINKNRPSHITTPEQFKREIIMRYKKRIGFKPNNDGGLIIELSKKYINKNLTRGEADDYLGKILKVVQEVRMKYKELSINTYDKLKKEIEKRLNKLIKNKEIKKELIKKKEIIKGLIQHRINEYEKKNQTGVSRVTNDEIETSIDDYLQNNDIQNKSYDDFIDYLFSKKTTMMDQIN
jgi:hypothetical protein